MRIGDGGVSYLFYRPRGMNTKEKEIVEKFGPKAEELGYFLVDVDVTSDNDITLTAEKAEGNMELDDCVALDEAFHAMWSQDEEDYSLTVTSAGLDRPFKVLRQFIKAKGTAVEVGLKGGRKLTATLADACEDSITLEYEEKGQRHTETYTMDKVAYVQPHITFDKE